MYIYLYIYLNNKNKNFKKLARGGFEPGSSAGTLDNQSIYPTTAALSLWFKGQHSCSSRSGCSGFLWRC